MLFSAAAGSSSKLGFHPIKCDIHPVESNFQTRSGAEGQGEVFLRHEKPIAFLYTTARNLVLEYYKKDKSNIIELDEARITAFGKDAYEELCLWKSDCVNEVSYQKQVLQKLQPEERSLYRKYFIEKQPMKAIATDLQMNEPAIRMKYMRIRRKVRKIAADRL